MTRLGAWARARRSAVATGVSAVVITALVVTVAVVSTGYEAQRLDLDDGTVWVANGSRTAVGRANTDVAELNAAVRSTGGDLSVTQSPDAVLMVDRSSATVGIVDPATSTVGDSAPLPPESPDVLLTGDRAVVVSGGTGELWSLPVSDLASFSSEDDADLSLGEDAVTSVAPDGTITVFSAASGDVSRVASGDAFDVDSTRSTALAGPGEHQVTSVGTHWAVLDVDAGHLVVDGEEVDLSGSAAGGLALQQASDDGDGVLVATSEALLRVPFGGGEPSEVVTGQTGLPARPVVVGSCTWAAWSGGTAWSDCSRSRGGVLQLDGVPGAAPLVFDVNGRRTVLSDPVGGGSWAVQSRGQLIDNWDELLDRDDEQQEEETDSTDEPPELDPDQKPPVAVDDDLGARPGRASTLSVLLNDYDPNGDPLVVDQVSDLDPATGRLDVVNDRQQVLLTLTDEAAGAFTFDYTISDGRGGTATSTVTITVREAGENSPPAQVRRTSADVSSSGRVTTSVLGDWVDPDGDAFYLTSAVGDEGVSYKPSGDVVYQDAGSGATTLDVGLVVSDGQAEGRGSMTIRVAGSSPLTADSFSVQAYAGQQLTVRPLPYASGGSGSIRLNSVPAKNGSIVTPSYESGTFRFVSDEVRTHNLEYSVTDGDQTATGTIRVDVQSPPDPSSPPITTPKTVFVETLSSQTLDVVATDHDPAGNVLMVTSTSEVPLSSGVRVETLDQRYLRLTLAAPLDQGPVTFTYTVTNGLASAEGTVTVIETPRRSQTQPPVATDDQVTVRVGDAIDIDVLANDEQPDGDEITLVPDLVQDVPADGGLLFASGSILRYLAPTTPGNVTAVYAVEGRDGQRDTAQVTIAVREADVATNNPPVPQTVTARVVAGESVRVTVPLDGVDPDGDSVSLLGVGTNPENGSVTSVGTDSIQYEANGTSAGTDTFTYTVVDGLGARASGKVRIGISARADGSRNPIAVADDVTMRPGGTITVRVLDNDSDPDGGALTVTGVEANDVDTSAEVVDGALVAVRPPAAEGQYGLVYTVENDQGGSSSSFVTVDVDADAPLNRPVVDDTVLDLSDIAGRQSVDVNVLTNAFFADGPASSLGLDLTPGYGGTSQVTPDRRVRVTITDSSQIIPFSVSHPDDPAVRTYAFIRVPGFDDALPQLDKTARPLTVVSGDRLTIDLTRYVIAAGGKTVRLTGEDSVRATHADGADLVVGPTTLAFTSEDLYFGTASVSFEVTDGSSADDPAGRTATLVLPITVTPRENQPPTFTGTSVDLEPGQSRTLDLQRLTSYPYPDDVAELRWTADAQSVPGFAVDLSGREITITADAGTPKGTTRALPVTVADAVTTGQPGSIRLAVVGSTRPLAQPAADTQAVRRGTSATIDVLANDQATNPFPGQPLRVVDIRGLGGGGLPAGVSVTPSADNRTLAVSVGQSAQPGDTNLQYRVADVTDDPDRYVWGNVTISVQDVPDAPAAPVRTGTFTGGQLTLSYAAPQANNSPLTRFRLTGTGSAGGSYSKDCGLSTVCTLTDLDPEQTFRFTVVATNALGDSAPSAASPSYSADFVPAPPTGVTVRPSSTTPGALDVSWEPVPKPARGTSVLSAGGYVVEVNGSVAQTVSGLSTTLTGLSAGSVYSVTVYARNRAQVSSEADWARSAGRTETAFGYPSGTGPSAAAQSNGSIQVSWTKPQDLAGDGSISYQVFRYDGTPSTAQCGRSGTPFTPAEGVLSITDTTAARGGNYVYVVNASNRSGLCSASATSSIGAAPGTVDAALTMSQQGNQVDVQVERLRESTGASGVSYQRLSDGDWVPVSEGTFITGVRFGTQYGSPVDVSFRACRAASCSDQVTTVRSDRPLQLEAKIRSCVVSSSDAQSRLDYVPPANAGVKDTDVSYKVEYERPAPSILDPNRYAWASAADDQFVVPDDARAARIKATVLGFEAAEFTLTACSPAPPL
ncbi:tandem-95 repeat protein [Frigoribacterium sp. ACAM 257]|uniref:Ig-like domain-containing protein n=1 Tax=Frigoribacterium sp. ACAM 257 TaxID=2508998 RepID=UPI0011B97BAE|nr:Ig-like domain-containing protein [Frigoribacterium sp. ACAM 257]TWX40486.1 tandem-95 repeat protein [Frigoribacterium sp. ACAM 257]